MTKKFRKSEIALYIVAGIIFLVGLTLLILGLIADNGIGKDNSFTDLYINQKEWLTRTGSNLLSFRNMGFMVIALSTIIAIITLSLNADYFARQKEREERKQIRKRKMESVLSDNTNKTEKE